MSTVRYSTSERLYEPRPHITVSSSTRSTPTPTTMVILSRGTMSSTRCFTIDDTAWEARLRATMVDVLHQMFDKYLGERGRTSTRWRFRVYYERVER